jgi:HK97 gp10 family phage protein
VAAVEFRVTGLGSLERRLKAMPGKIERACLRKALRNSANKVARRLKAATPRGLGAAQRSVGVRVRVNARQGAYAVIKYRRRPAAYMGMRERGTRRQPARPFFRQAVSGWEQETIADLRAGLKAAVESAEASLG